jgi:hypothetical protein
VEKDGSDMKIKLDEYVERVVSTMPIAWYRLMLFIPETLEAIGAGVLLFIYIGLLMGIGSGTAFASPIAFIDVSSSSESGTAASILVALVGIATLTGLGILGYTIRDRIGWAERKRDIENHTKQIEDLRKDLEASKERQRADETKTTVNTDHLATLGKNIENVAKDVKESVSWREHNTFVKTLKEQHDAQIIVLKEMSDRTEMILQTLAGKANK